MFAVVGLCLLERSIVIDGGVKAVAWVFCGRKKDMLQLFVACGEVVRKTRK